MDTRFPVIGETEKKILRRLEEEALHMTVLDPEKLSEDDFAEKGKIAAEEGTDIIAVGGSMSISDLDAKLKSLKKSIHVPLLIFPSNVWSVSRYADAILFVHLLNTRSAYFATDVPILLAPLVFQARIEAIPTGYMLFEPGGTAGWVADAKVIPRKNLTVARACALSGVYSGARLIFMEAGSGSETPIQGEIIREVKKTINVPLAVGSGIRTPRQAAQAVESGADIVDTGNIFEKTGTIRTIVEAVKSARRRP